MLILIEVVGNLVFGYVGSSFIVCIPFSNLSAPSTLDIINQLATTYRLLLNWLWFSLLGRNREVVFKELALNFKILELAFNQGLVELKELNCILISNFFCDLLQTDYGILNWTRKIVFNNLSILLWHQVNNFIVLNSNLCVVKLNELYDLIVSTKFIFNFNIFGRVLLKLVKINFSFYVLVLLHLLLWVFSSLHFFLNKVVHKIDLFLCCLSGLFTYSYKKSGFLTRKACDIKLIFNLRLAWVQNWVSVNFILDNVLLKENITCELLQVF